MAKQPPPSNASSVKGQPATLSAAEAQKVVRDIVQVPGAVTVVRHGKQRQKERQVDQNDVRRVLERGWVTEGPYIANRTGNWRLNITGRSAGEELTLVVEIEWRTRILVITVIR